MIELAVLAIIGFTLVALFAAAAVVLALTPGVMPAGAAQRGRVDVLGALTVTLGLAALVFAVVRAPEVGWGSADTVVTGPAPVCTETPAELALRIKDCWVVGLPPPTVTPKGPGAEIARRVNTGLPARTVTALVDEPLKLVSVTETVPVPLVRNACAVLAKVAKSIVTEAADGATTTPNQRDGAGAALDWNTTGDTAVPFTSSSPATVSSTRVVSRPDACESVEAKRTTVPASIVSTAPAGTVMSPATL